VGAGHQRHVETVVHEHTGSRARHAAQARPHQHRKGAGLEMWFTNLNQLDAETGDSIRAADDVFARTRQVGISAGDHAEHRGHGLLAG
jgi:hypothetical protein